MRIVTTHLHADFDCVASMVAARRLYPDAVALFPGSQEQHVRAWLERDGGELLPYRRLRGFPLEQVTEVILVDASTRERIGPLGRLADRPEVTFTVFDHHPAGGGTDLPRAEAVILPRGSTVTIMTEMMRQREIEPTPGEATLMILGLYEDTGSLSFASTTPEDFDAARWLLTRGADLTAVPEALSPDLTPAQVELLDRLLKGMDARPREGLMVGIVPLSADPGVGDVAGLVSRAMEMTSLPALFALFRLGDRIHLVARSRDRALDAGKVARAFGGGGHRTAASATTRELTLPQALALLERTIDECVEPLPTTADLMLTHVVTVTEEQTLAEAERLMTRYDVNGLPVVDGGGRPVGLILRPVVEKGLHHGLGDHPVTDLMSGDIAVVTPGAPLERMEEIAFGRRQKKVPVVDPADGRLVGLATRGMILQRRYGDRFHRLPSPPAQSAGPRHTPATRDMTPLMERHLDPDIAALLEKVRQVAAERSTPAYVAGGFVRDLLLGIRNRDVDVVVEGDGIAFAHALAPRLGGRVQAHEAFKTAVVVTGGDGKIDVATARMEYYAHPAALPTVEQSAIRNDLYRRDFSLNAMAVRLDGDRPNLLLDYFNGQTDLHDHAIRVLHNLSFVEDPTRAFRAVRFEARYGFTMGRQTLALLKAAVARRLLDRLSPSRLFTELRLLLAEERAARGVARLAELDLLRLVHPRLAPGPSVHELLERLDRLIHWATIACADDPRFTPWIGRLALLAIPLSDDEFEEATARFPTARKWFARVRQWRHTCDRGLRLLRGSPLPSRIADLHEGVGTEGVLALAARAGSDEATAAVTTYLGERRRLTPLLNGREVMEELGIPRSALVGRLLREVREAQLDGGVATRADALALARALVAREGGVSFS